MKRKLVLWLFGLLLTVQMYAQNRTISGTVKDAKGEALIGVNVTGKGTTIGTVTDIDGKYTLELPKEVSALVFSYVGYTTLEKAVTAKTIDAVLNEEGKVLEDVVVTAVAVKREKRSTSFATTTVKADDLNQTTNTALTSLQGKAPGVKITQGNGQLGASSKVVLRGDVSFSGNNNALIVVDGIPINNSGSGQYGGTGDIDMGNRSNDLNPDDIESVSVLKGPAATALYGSRAASGVLLITTKKGQSAAKEGRKVRVTISSALSFDKAYVLYKTQDKYGQGYSNRIVLGENLSWGPKFDNMVRPWTNIVTDTAGNISQLYKPYSSIKKHLESFYNLGITNTNSIAIEGGSDNFNYRVSYGNVNNKGIVPNNYYKRHNISAVAEAKLAKIISSEFSVAYSNTKLRNNFSGNDQFLNPLDALVNTPTDIPFTALRDYKSDPYAGFEGYYGAWSANPYFLLGEYENTINTDNILAHLGLTFSPIKELDITARLGTNITHNFIQYKEPVFDYPDWLLNDDGPGSGTDINGIEHANKDLYGIGNYEETTEKGNDLNIDVFANYKNTFGKKKWFSFNALGGFNFVENRYYSQTSKTNAGLTFPGIYDISNSNAQALTEDSKTMKRLAGIYANVTFGIKNALFLEYSARNDWSSTLPLAGHRGFFYQSGGVSFVPTEFFKEPNKYFNYLKLRFNAGTVGKDPGFAWANTVVSINPVYTDHQYPIDVNGSSFNGLTVDNAAGNSKIKPEITLTYEGGVDMGLFQDRLTIEATGYYQLSKDQIVKAPAAPSSGYTTALLNVGKISNKGVELGVRTTPIRDLKHISWSFYLNYSMNRSKVLKTSTDDGDLSFGSWGGAQLVASEGKPFGIFKATGYEYDSLGRIIINYGNALPKEATTPTYFGSIQSKYNLGFGSTFSWKGLSASVAFDLKKGGTFYSWTKSQGEFAGSALSTLINDRQPIIIPNSSYLDPVTNQYVANTNIQTPITSDYFGNLPASEELVDASYIKLREVTLSYTLDKKFFKNTPLTGITIGAYGRNLKTWLPKSNTFADPEFGSVAGAASNNFQGFENVTTPYSRNYGFEFKIVF